MSLLVLLQNRRTTTAAEAAAQLGVSVRTVQRDVDVLSAAGVPVYTERGRGGGLRLREGYTTQLTGLSSEEAEALALVSTPSVLADLDIEQPFASAAEKITAAIPAVHQLRARHARNRLMFDTAPWFRESTPHASTTILDALREAVWADRVCRLEYRRGDGVQRRYRLDVYALVAKVDVWYLVGRTADGMRVFRLSRIQHLEVTDDTFERDAGFELTRFWKRWCRRFETQPIARYWVTLTLTAAGRDRLLTDYGGWHRAALSSWDHEQERNRVTLDLENEDIAARVLFDLGGEARVLDPAALRRTIRDRARALLEGGGS